LLHEFLLRNTDEILTRTRAKVAARTVPIPTEAELKNGVPLFLSQLINRLSLGKVDGGAMQESATLHGGELLAMGFTVSQVVHGYGDVCQVITQLADETDASITADEFNTFNRCLDDAIAFSVTEFERRRDKLLAYEGTERLGLLAHELRNRVSAATVSFRILQRGTVGIGGSTGAVLDRSLRALRELVNSSLAGVRIESGVGHHHRVSVGELIRDVEAEASMGADGSGFRLTVSPVERGIDVGADPQILSAAIGNLIQNAFKFGSPNGQVLLRTSATTDRVVIEVEDECGGLPPGRAEELFRPFEQRSANRAGLGLGLFMSRKGVEAMGGKIGVRDRPGKGCIFYIDLPRLPAPVAD
jgi:signal transduction histidine kinase